MDFTKHSVEGAGACEIPCCKRFLENLPTPASIGSPQGRGEFILALLFGITKGVLSTNIYRETVFLDLIRSESICGAFGKIGSCFIENSGL
ncbi:hypothetical protein JTE90_010845 [Oedothorax gibbosus]|uniref:Uncharacterized protein n=1 Tax=Oedothorax gibbosus TaxID=931172 RepID=A0AAV6V3L1_9ARAC|nr:hypothetical protein JTE90_010845 [Oedothorax gibbosus]